jgi:cytochrome d ubiquinol oxidase subunit I
MPLDPVPLARAQFAFTIMFHYLFPPLSIGLGALLVMMEGRYLVTRDPVWESLARFWTRIFAVNFALGVASGIAMEFQFGTNWAGYSRFVGDVFGSVLAAEGIFAFFLESGFLAVLVFGWDRVSPRMHFFATTMVAFGAIFSAIWIVVANSWQQTPAGFHIVMRNGSRRAELVSGHFQAHKLSSTQPAKLAAFEGHYRAGEEGAPLHIFGIPDSARQRVNWSLAIPGGLSFLVHGNFDQSVTGLDAFRPDQRPPVPTPFYSYHLMVGLGLFFIALTVFGLILHRRGKLFEKRWLMWVFVVAVVGPYLSNELGWVAAEVGRQPWVVYDLLRTSDATSTVVPSIQIVASMAMFAVIYGLLFAVFVFVLNDKIQRGPDEVAAPGGKTGRGGLLEAAGSLAAHGRYTLTGTETGDEPNDEGGQG